MGLHPCSRCDKFLWTEFYKPNPEKPDSLPLMLKSFRSVAAVQDEMEIQNVLSGCRNVVPAIYFFKAKYSRRFFMKPCPEPLFSLYMRTPLAIDHAGMIVHNLLMGFDDVHGRKVLRGDLKPPNVLIDADARAVI
jgi:serine/threonine protein kinase